MLEGFRDSLAWGFNILAQRVSTEPRYPDPHRISGSPRTLAGVSITPDSAVTIATVWACLRYLSQTVAVLPWHVMKESENGSEIQSKNPLEYLIYKRPNPEWSSFQFRETLTHWALRWGNGYAEIERDAIGRPFALWPIHPDRVAVCRDPESRLLYYEVSNGSGGKVDIDAKDIFHIRGFGEGPIGVNVINYAAQSLGWAKAAQLFGASFFGNGANVSGVVINKRPLKEDGLRRQRAEFDKIYVGVRNSNKTAFLDNDADWKKIGLDAKETQLIEVHQYLVAEVCRWFGVPPHKVMDLLRATFCLPADALVATEEGPARIADVKVGDKVWSLGVDGQFALKPVLQSGPTGESRVLTIKTRGRTLRCNAQHRVLIRREFLTVATRGRGKYTAVDGVRHRKAWCNVYIPAGEIKVGDQLIAVDRLPIQESRQAPTREATVEFMELLGHLTGDGFYARDGRTKHLSTFGISHAVNDDCAPHYAAAAESVFSSVGRYAHGRTAGSLALKAVERDLNTTVFYSRAACEELKTCGVVGTAKTKRVPSWMFSLSPELQAAFLRGYLDADGTVNPSGQIRYVSCNRALLEDVRQMCMNVGVRCGEVFATERLSTFDGYDDTISTLFGLICSDPIANSRIGSNDPMRRNRLAGAVARRRKRTSILWDCEAKRRDAGTGLRANAVIAIVVSDDMEVVFDLSVADNHSFIANGVVVHNSNIEHQAIEVVVDSVTPWVKRFEDEADYKLFGAQNRNNLYTKMNLRALLRGDFKSQNEGFQIARQNGAINADEWREYMDLGSIGSEGKKYVMQSQYTTLERIGEEPVEPSPAEPAQPEEPATPDPAAQNAMAEFDRILASEPANAS